MVAVLPLDCLKRGLIFNNNVSVPNYYKVILVVLTELIMKIGHRKKIRKLTFRAFALRRSESRNCGLCVVYIQKDGATLLIGAWCI